MSAKINHTMAPKLNATFSKLLALAQRDNGNGSTPWTSADLIHQDALYEIQADYLEILLALATQLGAAHANALIKTLPWAYSMTPPRAP